MDLRDWLIVVGVIILLGILVDGYRRMRIAKKDSLKFAKGMGGDIDQSPLDEDFNPELPGGGARVVSRSGDDVSAGEQIEPHLGEATQEENIEATTLEIDVEVSVGDDLPVDSEDPALGERLVADQESRIEPDSTVIVAKASKRVEDETVSTDASDDGAPSAPEEVLIINVDAKTATGFSGVAIKDLLEACGLDHGDMSIFHRHEEDDLLSPIQFSVANAVEPGYFDPNTIEQLSTPGVSFFMSLPGPKDYMKAFDYMLETAQVFARQLDGELRDENRSVMTGQTIEHCRQRIREYERKQLSKARV